MTICFTGHRAQNLCGYDKNMYIYFVHQLEKIIEDLIKKGYTEFITGGAQGFDQLAFWAVHNVQKSSKQPIKNIVYIPFFNYGEQWKIAGLFSQEHLSIIKQHADEVHYVQHEIVSQKRDAVSALMQRNSAMIKNADTIIALTNLDWIDKANTGGTMAAIREAKKQSKKVLQLKYSKTPYLRITNTIEI